MPRHDDPAALSPDERLDELASIFADALLRLPKRTRATVMREPCSAEDSSQKALEVPPTLSPDPLGA